MFRIEYVFVLLKCCLQFANEGIFACQTEQQSRESVCERVRKGFKILIISMQDQLGKDWGLNTSVVHIRTAQECA